jgi:hypothetical protein
MEKNKSINANDLKISKEFRKKILEKQSYQCAKKTRIVGLEKYTCKLWKKEGKMKGKLIGNNYVIMKIDKNKNKSLDNLMAVCNSCHKIIISSLNKKKSNKNKFIDQLIEIPNEKIKRTDIKNNDILDLIYDDVDFIMPKKESNECSICFEPNPSSINNQKSFKQCTSSSMDFQSESRAFAMDPMGYPRALLADSLAK